VAALQVDKKQTPIIVALIVILVAAVGATVTRLNPGQSSNAPAKAQTQPGASEPVSTGVEVRCNPARNPFERPPALAGASQADQEGLPGKLPTDKSRANTVTVNPWSKGADSRLPQLETAPVDPPNAAQKSSDQPAGKQAEQRPEFTLLATVKGKDGYSAVIKAGEQAARVVQVGDKLDGRFKVLMLKAGMAVLTDGRKVIVARRPQS